MILGMYYLTLCKDELVKQVPETDAEGNPVLDGDGNPVMHPLYKVYQG